MANAHPAEVPRKLELDYPTERGLNPYPEIVTIMSGTSNRSVEVAVTRTTTMATTMTTTAAETRNPDESPAAATAARSTGAAPENRADEAELERLGATVRVVLRGLNGCAHALACAILVAIMAEFLARTQGAWVAAARCVLFFPPSLITYLPS